MSSLFAHKRDISLSSNLHKRPQKTHPFLLATHTSACLTLPWPSLAPEWADWPARPGSWPWGWLPSSCWRPRTEVEEECIPLPLLSTTWNWVRNGFTGKKEMWHLKLPAIWVRCQASPDNKVTKAYAMILISPPRTSCMRSSFMRLTASGAGRDCLLSMRYSREL